MTTRLAPLAALLLSALAAVGCSEYQESTAGKEQARTEKNQSDLLERQPPPKIDWSLERDNLIKRFLLQNDRAVTFYMYVFIEGTSAPVGYYMVNKVSSVNSQLTNTEQIIYGSHGGVAIPSPAEDGSYGENGDAVFGFTPEGVYLEHNMKYIASTIPLTFQQPVQLLAVINTPVAQQALKRSNDILSPGRAR